MEYFENNFTAK